MSCPTCNGNNDQADVRHICRVCELVDGDKTVKRVKYCEDCKAYLCEKCSNESFPYPRRALAMTKDKMEKLKNKAREVFNIAPVEKKYEDSEID